MLKPFSTKQLLEVLNKYLSHLLINIEPKKVASTESPLKSGSHSKPCKDMQDWLDMESIAAIRQIEKQSGRKILKRLLDMFEKEMQQKLDEIATVYAEQDAPKVAQIAHAMKSLTANVGAKKLRLHCQVIEQAGIADDLAYCEENINALELCYIESLQRLTALSEK